MKANRNYEVIFSDIDGTFINSHHQVTEKTKREVQRVVENGIPFILISSRMPDAILPIQQMAGIKGPIICYGGSLILDENLHTIYSQGLAVDTAVAAGKLIESEFGDIIWNMYYNNQWLCPDRQDQRIEREQRITDVQATKGKVEDVLQWGHVHKIMCVGEPQRIALLQERLTELFPTLFICQSSPYYLEITDSKVNKGKAIEWYCKLRHIPLEKTIAFGDNYNDLDMLETAGLGYVMDNAPEHIKSRIGNVTLSNNEDGVAVVLQKIV